MSGSGWYDVLGIPRPDLADVAWHREANTYSRLIVALLERDGPLTLAEAAARFEAVGITSQERALRSLQRCKPARVPVYRVDDQYHLDPHDQEAELWAVRLGLRPFGRGAPELRVVPDQPPDDDVPLTPDELEEAFTGAALSSWSQRRLALAVLDAHRRPMTHAEVVAALDRHTRLHPLGYATQIDRKGSPIGVDDAGRWFIHHGSEEAVLLARREVRARIVGRRALTAHLPTPSQVAARVAEADRARAERGAALDLASKAIVVAFPAHEPVAVTVLDIGAHALTTLTGPELQGLHDVLARYDALGGLDIRAQLRALGFEPGARRLLELGPPQKTMKLPRGGTLKITTALLIQGSCGLPKPFADPNALARWAAKGELAKLARRLEADARSLHALYAYGRLHGNVRLRRGSVDEQLPAPWCHRDQAVLFDLKRDALARGAELEIVAGTAPGWEDPWDRAFRVRVYRGLDRWSSWIEDDLGDLVDEKLIQRARLAPG